MIIVKRVLAIIVILAIFASGITFFNSVIPTLAEGGEDDKFQASPLNPAFIEFLEEPPENFYGYIPPSIDLSHLGGSPVQSGQALPTQPPAFDWRDTGKVTPVGNQNPCGTCWAFGTTSVLESAVLIGESVTYDFSEQSVALCVDRSYVYLYDDWDEPCGLITGHGGGNSFKASDVFIKKGAVLESCNPYDGSALQCDGTCVCDSCTPVKKVTGYRYVTDDGSQTALIKTAVYNNGPVTMIFYYNSSGEYADGTYGAIYDYYPCSTNPNHLVSIIGWNDAVPHLDPDHSGTGAWLVKNSWGTADSWAGGATTSDGYFWLAYDSSCMTEIAYLEYKDYDPNEMLYYWDEAGIREDVGAGSQTCWMASVFTSAQDGFLTHVDFWTTAEDASYEIYVYNDGDPSNGLTNQLAYQTGSCDEFGYYSIPLTSPVPVSNSQQFTIAVEMTTPGHNDPIPIEYEDTGYCEPPIQTGVCFLSVDGSSWTDAGDVYNWNTCLRARITSNIPPPTVTTDAASLVEETTATLDGDITDTGGENCVYRGFVWGDESHSNPGNTAPASSGYDSYWSESGSYGTGTFNHGISSLSEGTKYYCRACARNSAGWSYGSEQTFLTKPDAPSSFDATTAGTTQIDLSWTKGSGAEKTKIQREEGSYPTDRNDGTQVYFDTGTSTPDTGLTPGTTYYYRAWSYVQGSEQWSGNYTQASATTTAIEAPTVTTSAATLVEETTATLNGDITDTGGENCDFRGFVWGDESHSNPGNTAPASSGYDSYWSESGSYGTGTFNHGISSLSEGTKYYCRACARNSAGWSYGSEQTFLTKPDAPTSFDASTVSTTQIDLSWTKGDGAQKTKIQRKEGDYPSNRDDGTQVYFDTGTSTPDTGLTPGTTYYYRAWSYAQGSEQWSDNYTQASATTTPIGAPTVTTDAASLVEETTATLNGDITDTGGENCDYRGFVWGDESHGNPGNTAPAGSGYDSNWSESGSYGTGTFNHGISSLSEGAKYYCRACARNSAGWSYGSEQTFLTKPDAPSSFDATTASTTQIDLSWTKGDGAQKTKIQRKEGDYPSNRDDGTQVYFDTGTSTPDTGLTPGTTYYYRAWSYAQGSEQWSDGSAEDYATTTTAQPDITVSPASFNKTLPSDTTHDYTLTISNAGDGALSYNISDGECPWLSESPTSGTVGPGDSHNITVTINTTGLAEGDYSAEIVIANNDPDEDPKIVPVTLHVVPTLELVEGVNIIPYTGATTSLPEALTNIAELVEIIWARGAWTGGEWHRFFFYNGFPMGELQELENGRAYIIVVSEACIWELPQ